jgi:hypothetical protein
VTKEKDGALHTRRLSLCMSNFDMQNHLKS